MDSDEEPEDLAGQVKAVKDNVISQKTVAIYVRGICRYVAWLYEKKRNVLCDSFLGTLHGGDLEQSNAGTTSLKKASIARFMSEHPDLSPINYELHRAQDFEEFLMSLTGRTGGKPGQSIYDSMRSSLFHLYRGYGRSIPLEFAGDLTVLFKGLKRSVARRNHDAGVKLTEGKEPLSFSLLRSLCSTFLKHENEEFVFAHTFLLLSWNLMCRTGNTASIHSGHTSWDGDALAIMFCHMKNDQDGTRPRDARHVYANPFNPDICPVLSLAVYAAVLGIADAKIFPGGNQYDRFSKLLKRVLWGTEMKSLLENEGLVASDIGTHSARKGSATFVSSCSNGGPSAASICIGAGWTLPGVQDTYIRYESAGDRIVGHYVAGLPFNDAGFTFLPPFFPPEVDELINAGINLCLNNLPSHLHRAGGFLLASLVYHLEYLRTTLSDQHPLFRKALFGNAAQVTELQQRILCRTTRPTDRVRPTGIPPHVHLLAAIKNQATHLQQLSVSMDKLAPTVVELMKSEISRCHSSLSALELNSSISKALTVWRSALAESCEFNLTQTRGDLCVDRGG